jgi:hypothetical protein
MKEQGPVWHPNQTTDFFALVGIEHRILGMLGKCSTNELQPQPQPRGFLMWYLYPFHFNASPFLSVKKQVKTDLKIIFILPF